MMKLITWLTIALFVFIAALAFILSFNALQVTAANNGKSGVLSYGWPLLIDGGLVIFSLAVVYKSLRGENARTQWCLVILFTVATVFFNVFQEANTVVKMLVAGSAPVVLFLTFETLMNMVRGGVQRKDYLNTLDTMRAEIEQVYSEREKLNKQVKRLENKEKRLSEQPVYEQTHRQQQLVQLVQKGVTNKSEIARQLGVQRNTVYNELNTLKAQGVLSENGNGLEVCAI